MKKIKNNKLLKVISIALSLAAAAGIVIYLNIAYNIPILMYHSIDNNDKETKLSASPRDFARQMKFLVDQHYNVVPLEKVIDYIRKKEPVPAKTTAITFDDGFYNNYKYAYPILKKYTIPATIFVIVNRVGTEGFLSWDNIKEMSDSGIITIGSHTKSHIWLLHSADEFLKDELAGSKEVIESKIGKSVKLFCYPMGAFDQKSKAAVKDYGYLCAVTTNPRNVKDGDIFALKRIKISRSCDNLFIFWFKLSGYYAWFKNR